MSFPFLLGGAFIEADAVKVSQLKDSVFPFLLGGAFIEAIRAGREPGISGDFPSFLEGLSLRQRKETLKMAHLHTFPFLLGGAFIEAGKSTTFRICARRISLPSWRGFH